MRFFNTITAILMAGSVTAFKLPGGLANGVYSVHLDKDGNEVHELIAPANYNGSSVITNRSGSDKEKRQGLVNGYQIYCGCGYTMDPGDTDAAVNNLSGQFGGYDGTSCAVIGENMAFYAISNSVVAFGCNDEYQNTEECGQEYGDQLKTVTAACGSYIAGTYAEMSYEIFGNLWIANFGYMRYSDGLDFCGNADTSPASSC